MFIFDNIPTEPHEHEIWKELPHRILQQLACNFFFHSPEGWQPRRNMAQNDQGSFEVVVMTLGRPGTEMTVSAG